LDADSGFALVFVDDVAALYVRRVVALSPVTERFGYRLLPGGAARISDLQRRCAADSIVCRDLEAELRRAIARAPWTAGARSLLANGARSPGRPAEARAQLDTALAVDPGTLRAHERLGIMALRDNDPRGALKEFQAELRHNGPLPGLWLRMGEAQ